MSELVNVYRGWSDSQLLDAYSQKNTYRPEAMEAMKIVIIERGLTESSEKKQTDYQHPEIQQTTGSVKYKKWFGIFSVTVSLFILVVAIITERYSVSLATALILFVTGILYLVNPVATYDEREITVKNLFGATVSSYSFEKDKIEVKDGMIYTNDKKIRLPRSYVNTVEFEDLINFVSNR